MTSRGSEIVSNLRIQLGRHYPSWQVDNLRSEGAGLEFVVCRGDSPRYGPLAFRVPWNKRIANDNDESIDARDLLRQEVILASHARAFGIPSPLVHHLHIGTDGFDFLASEFVISDGSSPDPHLFGQLLRAIHATVPCLTQNWLCRVREAGDLIAERLLRRSGVIERIVGMNLPLSQSDLVRAVLAQSSGRLSLLHMDARPENLLTWKGTVRGVIDWSNALIGSPALELARIGEYGHLKSDFLSGYGDSEAIEVPLREELLYRLDTVVMLALVFLSEAPNAGRAKAQIARVVSLCEAFQGGEP